MRVFRTCPIAALEAEIEVIEQGYILLFNEWIDSYGQYVIEYTYKIEPCKNCNGPMHIRGFWDVCYNCRITRKAR
jgi:hypothetical protein